MALPAFSNKTNAQKPEKLDGDTRFLDPHIMARIGNLEMVARFIVEGFLIGLHKSPYHGISSEFASYRKYTKGDPFKFIDWKAAARTDRIFIKQFEEQTNTRCHLLIDASASMAFGGPDARADGTRSLGIQKWIYARNLAAALAYLIIKQGDAIGLAIFRDDKPELLRARGGKIQLKATLNALAKAQPGSGTDSEKGLAQLPERIPARGLIIIISDLLDDTDKILGALRGFRIRQHEVILFHILTPEEQDFPYRENIEFVDAETGQTLTAQGSYIAEAYKKSADEHVSKIKRYCRNNNIDFVPLNTNENLSKALVAFLNTRQRIRK